MFFKSTKVEMLQHSELHHVFPHPNKDPQKTNRSAAPQTAPLALQLATNPQQPHVALGPFGWG